MRLCAQHYFGGGPGSGAAKPQVQGVAKANGVTKLMQQCTSMLRERMCDGLSTPQHVAPSRSHPGTLPARVPPLHRTLECQLDELNKTLSDGKEKQRCDDTCMAASNCGQQAFPALPLRHPCRNMDSGVLFLGQKK